MKKEVFVHMGHVKFIHHPKFAILVNRGLTLFSHPNIASFLFLDV